MDDIGLKVVGTAVILAGLMTGVFLAGGLAKDGSGAEPTVSGTPVRTQHADQDDDERAIVLVGDEEDVHDEGNKQDEVGQTTEGTDETEAPSQPQQPGPQQSATPPAHNPVEQNPEPQPAPPTPEP